MEKLIKPADYAREFGISRQAVYAKIKRGILNAKNIEGKLYIIMDGTETLQQSPAQKAVPKPAVEGKIPKVNTAPKAEMKDYRALLKAKDETISVLKGTVKDLKKSNKQISTTLRGEIDLLKDAFHEMRTLYRHQLEYKRSKETIEIVTQEDVVMQEEVLVNEEAVLNEEIIAPVKIVRKKKRVEPKIERWISIKKFLKLEGITKEKEEEKLAKRLKNAFRSGDERLMQIDGKLKLNANKKYKDIFK
ncbi:MAG TPA: DUF3972 domain-containing protein [bacterium (Candidatus Stahlbacteria)]|nr:DUF3972 domain-containing protein [Candidatus Stahlbacteria bacterium]